MNKEIMRRLLELLEYKDDELDRVKQTKVRDVPVFVTSDSDVMTGSMIFTNTTDWRLKNGTEL